MIRVVRCFLLVASAACVAMLGVGYYDLVQRNAATVPALRFDDPQQTLTGVTVGTTCSVAFRVVNDSGQTRRILGAELG
jgi:TRAP-type C4-dicarboxylate transport system permease small subunit